MQPTSVCGESKDSTTLAKIRQSPYSSQSRDCSFDSRCIDSARLTSVTLRHLFGYQSAFVETSSLAASDGLDVRISASMRRASSSSDLAYANSSCGEAKATPTSPSRSHSISTWVSDLTTLGLSTLQRVLPNVQHDRPEAAAARWAAWGRWNS
jgi:hypothetical protein